MSHHISAMGIALIGRAFLAYIPEAEAREAACADLCALLSRDEARTLRQVAGLPENVPERAVEPPVRLADTETVRKWLQKANDYADRYQEMACESSPTELHRFERGTCIYCGERVGNMDEDRVREERQDRKYHE